jgi:hypothetical protein
MDAATATATTRPPLGRRTYIIDRAFQLKYTVLLAVVGAFLSGLFGSLMYLAHTEAGRALDLAAQQAGHTFPAELRTAFAQVDATLISLLVSATLLMGASLGLFGVLVTHRVAGPVYVMTQYILSLATGRYPKMRPLRKGDELKSFFERIQQAIEALRIREADEARQLEQAAARLQPLAATPEAKEALDSLLALSARKRGATAEARV